MPPRRRKPPRAGALTELPPLKIIRSIILLQLSYYSAAFVLILFTTLVLGQGFSLGLLFDWQIVRGDNTVGWTVGFLWVVDGLIIVMPIMVMVARSKLVPDFALTIHFIHLLATSFYTRSLPTNLLWWGLEAASTAVTIILGMWACRYRELRPISFGTVPAKTSLDTPGDNVRGAYGRGRNVDSGPSYEMVNVIRGDENV